MVMSGSGATPPPQNDAVTTASCALQCCFLYSKGPRSRTRPVGQNVSLKSGKSETSGTLIDEGGGGSVGAERGHVAVLRLMATSAVPIYCTYTWFDT